jgi:hypothetical protein
MAIGTMAVVLGVATAGGYAVGEDAVQPAAAPKPTVQKKADERAALEEHQKRKEAFQRACNKPLKSSAELELCREAYKRLNAGS